LAIEGDCLRDTGSRYSRVIAVIYLEVVVVVDA
jgi:hypothetical protein